AVLGAANPAFVCIGHFWHILRILCQLVADHATPCARFAIIARLLREGWSIVPTKHRSGFMAKDIKKVVLAYSGGLDTSIILKWLQETYECEVVTFTADLGQGEELEPARRKAEMFGIKDIHIEDLREEFVRDFVFPMFRANTVYEGQYLLGTSIA